MISFFDLSKTELTPFINKLWRSSSRNVSLYIRGSSLLPMESNLGKPIDIDFLLFAHGEINKIKSISAEISSYANEASPLTPHLDIKVINCSVESSELLFNTLLVTKTGKLLYGKDLSVSTALLIDKQRDIILFTLLEAESKLNSVIQTSNKKIQNKRVPHLSKAILRIAGLLRLKEGSYTRSPQGCADVLNKRYPKIIRHVALILHSFTLPLLTDELLISYSIVLNEIKQEVELA
ncbi:hypothetical protein [Colwellia ponticola]|uniref:Uncharacterized protein n=1 Tax=Colwellia ponticola TaxID=2304625 RepID=A0A8H2JL20_9GAMM|nr:hypothetical protein [Colwellia ponticola]TMM45383.1 hypothetical protein FCS21_08285 [Colwellia ponticola]